MKEELLLQSQISINISEGVSLIKADDGKIVFTNPKFDEMFGYMSGELIGKHISKINAPTENKSPEKKAREIMNSLSKNNVWKGEVCNIKKDGAIFWCFASVSWFNHPKYGKVAVSVSRDITEQKQVEKELLISKERLKDFMHSATDGFVLFDSELNHIDINNKALELTGLSRSEVIGKNLIDVVPDVIDSGRYDEYKKVISTGKKYTKIFKPHPKFSDKLIELKAFRVQSGLGMILNDITAQKQVEKELQENEEKLRNIFENSTNLFYSHTAEHVLTYLSPQVNQILGYTPEETMINWTNFASNNPINEIGFNYTVKAIETGKQQPPYELELIHKSGRKVMVEVREAPVLKNGKTVSIVGALTDITERKKAENKLLKNQYYLKKAQEIGNIGTWELDIQKNILIWTDENYKIFGVPPGTEMNYELFLNCVHPDDKNYVHRKWSAALKNEPYDIEHRLIVNKKIKWVREKADIEFDTNNNPVMAIGFTQNITERKKAELELNKSNKKLREMTLYMQEALENERMKIALDLHDDLGQKLTALNMDLSWLKTKTLNNLPQLSDKLNEMTDLLKVTMQNVQKIATELRPSVLDDLGLVSAIEWLLKEYKNKSKLKYQFNVSPQELIIKKRLSVAIFRIIQEALTNVARHANATLVIVSIIKKNKLLNIVIEDNGNGITKKNIEDSRSFGLMGIKERANVFKGKVKIIGVPNKGTKLKVKIPYE